MDLFYFALTYTNGPIHIGHLVGSALKPDIIKRFLQARGHNTLFISGGDQFGQGNLDAANREGISPQEFTNQINEQQFETFQKLGISTDVYSKTNTPYHREFIEDFFQRLQEGVDYFTEGDKVFFNFEEHKSEIKTILQEYFTFPNNFKEKIFNHWEETREVSRDISWGVNINLKGKNVTLYVWIEALLGYFSFLKNSQDMELKEIFDSVTSCTYSMGVDNLYFHTVILAFLYLKLKKAYNLTIPSIKLLIQQHVLTGDVKMSKSLKNFITVDSLLEKYSTPQIRFVLAQLINSRKQSVYSPEVFDKDLKFFNKYIQPQIDNPITGEIQFIEKLEDISNLRHYINIIKTLLKSNCPDDIATAMYYLKPILGL